MNSVEEFSKGRRFIPALRFHVLTPFYDPVVRLTTRETRMKEFLVGGLGEAPRRILDVGSGTGTLLALLRSRYPTAELVGLDADARILEIARKKLGGDFEFVQGDALAPPFPAGSFDRVVSSLVLHHLTREQKLSALRAVRELLVEGGEIHIADWGAPHDIFMRAAFLFVQLLDGFETTRDNVEGSIPQLLTLAGFHDVEETRRQRTPVGSMSLYRGRR